MNTNDTTQGQSETPKTEKRLVEIYDAACTMLLHTNPEKVNEWQYCQLIEHARQFERTLTTAKAANTILKEEVTKQTIARQQAEVRNAELEAKTSEILLYNIEHKAWCHTTYESDKPCDCGLTAKLAALTATLKERKL